MTQAERVRHNKIYYEMTGLYATRYMANKYRKSNEVTVKVSGGYSNMDVADYNVWKKQK